MRRRWARRKQRQQKTGRTRALARGWALGMGVAALCAGSLPAAAESITGVCPDGSVYIVQSEQAIPCRNSKQVDPSDVPPVRPEYLPTPYTWQVYNKLQDENNPYNLIDAAREIRALHGQGTGAGEAGGSQEASAPVSGESEGQAAPDQVASHPVDLGLSDEELHSLYEIVALLQNRTTAEATRETADGRGLFTVRFAHSEAFEGRLRQAWSSRGGLSGNGVLIFSAHSKVSETFHGNFTLVQQHYTFQPDLSDPAQFGLVAGRLGELEGDELVLGYLVLPESMSLGEELDIYWNDRLIRAQF